MKKVVSTFIKYGLPLLLSVLLVWFFCTHVDMQAVRRSFNHDLDQWFWVIPFAVISVLSHVFRALRWRLQLRAIGVRAPLSSIIDSIFGTYFVNLLLPRMGEVWRAGYIANRQKASFSKLAGSMVGDRLSDTVTVAVLIVITFFLAQKQVMEFLNMKNGHEGAAGSVYGLWWFWLLVVLLLLGAAWLVWLCRTADKGGALGKVQRVSCNLWEGLASIARMEGKGRFLLYTVLIWGCYYSTLYLATRAFCFTRPLSASAVLVLFTFSSLGMGIPTNGGIGAWQYAVIFGLAIYGVGTLPLSDPYDAQATSFAWVVWLASQIVVVLLGIYAFIHIEIDRRRIESGKVTVESSGNAMQL